MPGARLSKAWGNTLRAQRSTWLSDGRKQLKVGSDANAGFEII